MLPSSFLSALKDLFSEKQLYTEPSDCWVYGYDNSRGHALPQAVVFANSHQDIVNIVTLCYEHEVPLTARGRASGTTGGAIPIQGGIVLSLERMQEIISFDILNRTMTVQAGVLNSTVQDLAKKNNLFWAPNPTSSPYCSIGGNLACNAAGPRSLKYGTTRENTLGLTAVIGTGETIQCGVFTSKSAVGYDLTRLFIGSEGTLGIISTATLKLLPLPIAKRTFRALYNSSLGAASVVTQIMSQAIIPCACELLDGNALKMIREFTATDLPVKAKGMIIIEIDGSPESLEQDMERMKSALEHSTLIEIKTAITLEESEAIWIIRKSLSQALRSLSPHKMNEDVVVPLSSIPELLHYTQILAEQFGITIVNFGHAGNGNIHVNLLVDPRSPTQGPKAKACLNLLFDKVIALNGCLSGEHGVGREKRDYVSKELSPQSIQLMKRIKSQFDPKGILNPGKLFSD